MQLPTLYKVTKTGATQTHSITITNNTYTVTQGQLDGKTQSYLTTCSPKNVGKANETSGAEQAIKEAQALWESKLKKGYTQTCGIPTTSQLPMKVKCYQNQVKNVVFPCYSTPKLNGVNATFTLANNTLILTSRGGELYKSLPHLESDIKRILTTLKTDRIAGELYIHGEHLQDITSYVKSQKPESSLLEFHIFDLPNVPGTYEQRLKVLQTIKSTAFVKLIPSTLCHSHDDINSHFKLCISYGFEGTVIYNSSALYEYNVRSSNIFKYKQAQSAEYQVVDYTTDKSGFPLLICKITNDLTFTVKPSGTAEQRKQLLNILPTKLGEYYTIEYETLSKNGTPLKPVGIAFRKCTPSGIPLE